ncbi:MAG: aspartate--tRNA ligase [Clostridiales bacterium]|jgi:aspartyl-tRNA synthetase|nr:aspartate--tRNA ligase [Clostridiales bacterium]
MAELLGGWKRDLRCAEVTEKDIGKELTLMGWVSRVRNMGGILFVWLRDRSGLIQLVFDQDHMDEATYKLGESLRGEYVLAIKGKVIARDTTAINDKMATGTIEVQVHQAKLLNEAATPPIYTEDGMNDNEAVRLKYRYLDLRRPSMQNMLKLRSSTVNAIRTHMVSRGFVEVETPVLTKSTPEGARDFLVPSRLHPNEFYALPQSPQIYKQLLMLSGLDRYFQFAKCFRDEDSRADRQPEFTQLDLEMSFVEPIDVQTVVEGAFHEVFKAVKNVDIALPLPRMTWKEAMESYGSDKPDLRFGMKISQHNDWAKDCGFSIFESAVTSGGTVCAIKAEGAAAHLSRKEMDALAEFAKTYHVKGLAWLAINEDGSLRSSFAKFIAEDKMAAFLKTMDAKPGDALFLIADKRLTALTAMGQLRVRLGKQLNLIAPDLYKLFWVTEFPLLEWNEEAKRYTAAHHPFTMPMEEDFHLLEEHPEQVRAKAYDLVLNGVEMGSGSIRIHSSDLQEKMFSLLGFTHEEAWKRFGFLLEAFKYGTPPHGGFAFGLDRLMMMLIGTDSLRDVIAFPKAQNASCLMMDTPSTVSEDQLQMLHLKQETAPDAK